MTKIKKPPLLGIFDSGVGGLSVYKEIRKVTNSNCIYYGDCLRAPYGNRDELEIVGFIKDSITFLQEKDVTHFVNACNSMSVLTTDALLKECAIDPDTYVDMIRAFDRYAMFNHGDSILVIATVATIRSNSYQQVLKNRGLRIFEYAYSDLAAAIENNLPYNELLEIIERSVLYAQDVGATHIVYGCTHYPVVHAIFLVAQEKLKWKGTFIDPAIYVAQMIKNWNVEGERMFCPYSSKDTPAFIKNVIKFL